MKRAGQILGSLLLYILLMVCVALVASPLLKYSMLESEGSKFNFRNFSADELEKNKVQAEDIEMEKDIVIPDLTGVLKHVKNADRKDVIGAVTIPAAGIYLPILNGTTKTNLMVGAGTMQPGQKMGERNYSLAGHHLKNKNLLFGPLLEVKDGDLIHLSDKKNVYTYEVTRTQVIHQKEIHVMKETETPSVTLITCDKTGVNTDYRLMVRGELIDTSESIDERNEYVQAFSQMDSVHEGSREYLLWIWAAGVAFIAGILLLISLKLLRGGKTAR